MSAWSVPSRLSLELAKFNVLTAFTAAEMLASAQRFDVDGFVVDSVLVQSDPCQLCADLKRGFGRKPLIVKKDAAPVPTPVPTPAAKAATGKKKAAKSSSQPPSATKGKANLARQVQ